MLKQKEQSWNHHCGTQERESADDGGVMPGKSFVFIVFYLCSITPLSSVDSLSLVPQWWFQECYF